MEWIRVDEYLPGDMSVLVCSRKGTMSVLTGRGLSALQHAAEREGENCYWTHWMPLPAPPPSKARSDDDLAKKE